MKCRPNCGACCIVPSISSEIPGMPNGKPAGVPCVHLSPDLQCMIYNSPDRPEVCRSFNADREICGDSREEAILIMSKLEDLSLDELQIESPNATWNVYRGI